MAAFAFLHYLLPAYFYLMAKVFTITEGLQNMGALKTGGQGSVYKAKRMSEIITAVKLLPTPIHTESDTDKNFAAFQAEVKKLKKVNEEPNPNIVKMLNYGITDSGSFPFIEMEFIEGPDLEELLKPPHEAVFTIKEAIKVAEQLSNALAHCHRLDVKHGDMKSNNVKFNEQTGNYMLLDFGLAAMSDEQRRTSLRHAGAVEFMAPEQSAGQLAFQTDVYGFGIIMFELLAGRVPFPLSDGSDTARNSVMLAHMETPPPDIKELRRGHLPHSWSSEKKEREMQVPDWLLSMIYRCLRKKPEERFDNGTELNNYIFVNSVNAPRSNVEAPSTDAWQTQAEKLLKEKSHLQQQLATKDAEIQRLKVAPTATGTERYPGQDDYSGNTKKNTAWIVAFLITLLLAGGLAYALIQSGKKDAVSGQTTATESKQTVPIGDFRVRADRTYFYNDADEATRRAAFLNKDALFTATDEKNGFVYTKFTNARGQVSVGWIKKDELITAAEWQQVQATKPAVPSADEIREKINSADAFLQNNQAAEALTIYNSLLQLNVPEAMYGAANLALQGKNAALTCDEAISLMRKASDAGNLTAKRTLGFLYMFAENAAVLSINGYSSCTFDKSFSKAKLFLTQAANGGDTTARRLLNELSLNNATGQPQ